MFDDQKTTEDRLGMKPASTLECIAFITLFVVATFSIALILGEVTGITDLAINSI